MKHLTRLLLLQGVIALAAFNAAPLVHAQEGAAPRSGAPRAMPAVIVRDTWIYVLDEPNAYFDRARMELLRNQPRQAAAHLRKAVALLDVEAGRAADLHWERLERSAGVLLVLADMMDSGELDDLSDLDLALTSVRCDLARHHAANATQAWAQQDAVVAGRSLATAARYSRVAMAAMDADASARSIDGLLAVEGFGDRISERGGSGADAEWVRACATLDDTLEALGREVEPGRQR